MPQKTWKQSLFECENSIFRYYIQSRIQLVEDIPLTYLGTEYSGYWIPTSLLESKGTLWGVGLGAESSFESELLNRGYFVYGFEPEDNCYRIASAELTDANSQIFNYGLWDKTGYFNYTGNNISLVNIFGLKKYSDEKIEIRSLWDVSRDLNLQRQSTPRILRMNIEGAEKQIIEKMTQEPLNFEVVIFQAEYLFHLGFWRIFSKIRESNHLIKQLRSFKSQRMHVVSISRHQLILLNGSLISHCGD